MYSIGIITINRDFVKGLFLLPGMGNISKIERGLARAPQSPEIKAKYAAALGIKEGTDDWLTFFDLAAADLGQIPEDLKGDERLLKSLPLLFRTVRDSELSEEELKKLIEALRKEQD